MSALSTNPTSPIQTRDIRSSAHATKRSRDAAAKPRPKSQLSSSPPTRLPHSHKPSSNKTPLVFDTSTHHKDGNNHTSTRKTSPALKSNSDSGDEGDNHASQEVFVNDEGILYSYGAEKRVDTQVGLGGLVEKAEKVWVSKETDRIVRKEWTVLRKEGEGREREVEDEGFELV